MKILITGITGSIASELADSLIGAGHEVIALSRTAHSQKYPVLTWEDLDSDVFVLPSGIDAVVHLAGASIGTTKWNDKGRLTILNSRAHTASRLFDGFLNAGYMPSLYLTASAIGFYDDTPGLPPAKETDLPGTGFLQKVCVAWEQQATQFREAGSRVVVVRLANILIPERGILSVFTKLIRFRLMVTPGNGRQTFCWIHHADVCRFMECAITKASFSGTYNLASTEQPNMAVFIKQVAKFIHRNNWFPHVPAWAIKIVMGEKSALLLTGRQVETNAIAKSGFTPQFLSLDSALKDCFNKKHLSEKK